MTRDFICRLEIGLQNRLLDIASAFVAARMHIDRDQRFRLVDHNVAAAFQPDLSMESVIDLLLDAVSFEDRRHCVIKMNSIPCAPRDLADDLDHPVGRCVICAKDFVYFFREKIAHGSLNQIGLLKYAARRGLLANDLLDLGPLIEEEPQVANEISGTLSFPYGGNDNPDPFGNVQFAQDLAKPLALLWILDFSRDSAVIAERHQYQVTPGETEVRRNPGPFRPNRSFGYLDNYVRTDRVNVRYIFCRDPFSWPLVRRPIDFFNSPVERGGHRHAKNKGGGFFGRQCA